MGASKRVSEISAAPGPMYDKIKRYIVGTIENGDYKPNEKLPSEQEYVEQFNVSRMTVHRALRELTADGVLVRMPGVGTFVCEPVHQAASLELKDIREEILARGNQHHCEVLRQEVIKARPDVCRALELPANTEVYHGLILHHENMAPIQLEERFIIEEYAAGFLEEDLKNHTMYEFLRARSTPTKIEHLVEAARPNARTTKLLKLNEHEPVLVIRRRTWVGKTIAVFTRFTYPGDRYYVVDSHSMLLSDFGKTGLKRVARR